MKNINFKKILLLLFFFCNINIYSRRIYINSIRKSGTNLLKKCIFLLTDLPIINKDLISTNDPINLPQDIIILKHTPFSEKNLKILKDNNFIGLFIYRDPRDQAVSEAFFTLKQPDLLKKFGYSNAKEVNFDELLVKTIKEVNNLYENYLPWLNQKLFYSLRFEDLIGPNGGGTLEKQKFTIKNILTHININVNKDKLDYCLNNLFGNTWTFREGKIGSWKKYFNNLHKKIFKELNVDLLIKLNYEKDNNW